MLFFAPFFILSKLNIPGDGAPRLPLTPVPIRDTLSGEDAALLTMLTVALREPSDEVAGWNVTLNTQDLPTASVLPQAELSAKSLALVPVIVIDVRLSELFQY